MRLTYTMNRRPLVTGIVMAAILWLLVWLLTGDVIISLIIGVVMSVASTLVRRSKYGQRNLRNGRTSIRTRLRNPAPRDYDEAAERLRVDPAAVKGSPHVLVGDTGQMVDALVEVRERWGLSYFVFFEHDAEKVMPVVRALAEP